VDGDTIYTFDLTPVADGLVTADIPGGVATSVAGSLLNNAAPQFSRTYDGTGPTVAMSSDASGLTYTSPIPVMVTFSEPAIGFSDTDIVAGNGTVGNFVDVGVGVYTFDLTPLADGLVTADIAAGVATDAVGNPNDVAPQFNRTYDGTSPTVAMTSDAPDLTNGVIPVTAKFSLPVNGFTATDIIAANGTVDNFVGVDGDTVYTFDLTPSADGLVTANIAAGVATSANLTFALTLTSALASSTARFASRLR